MKPVFVGILIFLSLVAAPVIYHRLWIYLDEREYRRNFGKVPGVVSVDYLNYEGHRNATLTTKNGERIYIIGFDESIFTHTNSINLVTIGDSLIQCGSNENGYYYVHNGINIVTFLSSPENSSRINNIFDLVRNYRIVYQYVKSTFPENRFGKKLI